MMVRYSNIKTTVYRGNFVGKREKLTPILSCNSFSQALELAQRLNQARPQRI